MAKVINKNGLRSVTVTVRTWDGKIVTGKTEKYSLEWDEDREAWTISYNVPRQGGFWCYIDQIVSLDGKRASEHSDLVKITSSRPEYY